MVPGHAVVTPPTSCRRPRTSTIRSASPKRLGDTGALGEGIDPIAELERTERAEGDSGTVDKDKDDGGKEGETDEDGGEGAAGQEPGDA